MEPRQQTTSSAEPAKRGAIYGEALGDKFDRYHRANPRVFELFLRFTLDLKARGRQHYSAQAVFERIRWHMDVETRDREGFKLNNSMTSRYTRLLETLFPEHKGFYRKRELRS